MFREFGFRCSAAGGSGKVGATAYPCMKLHIVGTANRRISNPPQADCKYRTAECRRVESLCSVFFKIGRIHSFEIRHSVFEIRPARNALKLVCGKFNHLIYKSMITPTQNTMHGRRVFAFSEFLLQSDWTLAASGSACMKLNEVKSEPQNIECRMSNAEGWIRFAQALLK